MSSGFNYMCTCSWLLQQRSNMASLTLCSTTLACTIPYRSRSICTRKRSYRETSALPRLKQRHRLFLSIYTLDMYTLIVWGRVVRSRDTQSNVLYPLAINDSYYISQAGYKQLITKSSVADLASPGVASVGGSSPCWLYCWNFSTDLYRIFGYALDQFRRRRPEHHLSMHVDTLFGDTPDCTELECP